MNNFKHLIASVAIFMISAIQPLLYGQSNAKDYTINFKSQQFLPEKNLTVFQQRATSVTKASLNGNYHVLIQFQSKLQLKDLQELKKNNIILGDYLGNNAYLATLPVSIDEQQLTSLNTRAVSVIPASAKLSTGIRSGEIPQWVNQKNGQVSLNVLISKAANLKDAINRIQQDGGTVTSQAHSKYGLLQISADYNNINAIAENGFVKSVEFIEAPLEHLNHKGPQSTRSSVETRLNGHNGEGIVVGVGDGGLVGHADLDGTILYQPSGPAYSWGDHPHHIAGTIAGKGTIDPWYSGVAPDAKLVVDYTSNIVYNSSSYHDNYGMSITNNSYGPGTFLCHTAGEYNSNSFWLDENSLERDKVLHIFAAGNSGDTDCSPFPYGYATVLRSYASSKNPLVIGAIKHRGHETVFSSVGPVKDGRIKPEVVASGLGVMSTGRSNNYIAYMGTSMATSTTSGAAAIISEVYKDKNGTLPDSDVLKAIIMNSAEDGGIEGPDYKYGFGMMNVNRAAELIRNDNFLTGTIDQGEAKQEFINVPANAHQVKIMVYWHDDPKPGLVTKALVNDLDLEVTNNNGTTFLPYVLDHTPANVTNPAVRKVDTLNNVEQVVLTSSEITQQIAITIKGTDVPFGTRKYVLVYDIVMPEVQMTYPAGGESMVPDDRIEIIRWSSFGVNSEDVTLELSLDNGNSWNNLALSADNKAYKYYNWAIPANYRSDAARFRISNTVTGKSHMNPIPFTLIPKAKNMTIASNCSGKVKLVWEGAENIAKYEVFRKDTIMELIGVTSGNAFLISGLTDGDEEWFTIQAVTEQGTKGNRIGAINVIVNGTSCTPGVDVGISGMLNPLKSGRRLTASTLNNQFVEIEISNYGTNTATNFPVSYQVNNQPPVTELFTGSLASGASTTFTFNETISNITAGTQQIRVWTALANDVLAANDSPAPIELTEFPNEYLAASSFPLSFNFDNMTESVAREDELGFAGIGCLDVTTNDLGGRIKINAGLGYNTSGSQNSVTLDAQNLINSPTATNELMFTFNLANYDSSWDGLFLEFDYMTHYLFPNSKNKVYVRASDTDLWVELYNIEDGQLANGQMKTVEPINILDALGFSTIVKGKLTSSLQVKFVQDGAEESNDAYGDGGYTIDKVRMNIGTTLPVELVDFNAEKIDFDAMLTWETATEFNNSHFNIQVATETVKGQVTDFKTIGKLDGAGTTLVAQAYRFLDEETAKAGNRYYRLEQVDFDGATSYSPTKVLNFSEHVIEMAVYPNPVSDRLTVQLDAPSNGTLDVVITDVTGKLLESLSFEVELGLNNNTIELDDRYTGGVYFVNTNMDGFITNQKIIKSSN